MGNVLLVQKDGTVFASSAGNRVVDPEHHLLAHQELTEVVASCEREWLFKGIRKKKCEKKMKEGKFWTGEKVDVAISSSDRISFFWCKKS